MNNELIKTPETIGMQFQPDLPFEEWQELGQRFGEATKHFSWALGDWILHGADNFKQQISTDIYLKAEKVTGVDRQSLLSFATVCRRIPAEDRIPHLSFQHHQSVASIANGERRETWLKFLSTEEKTPSNKMLKLSISCSPDAPKIISADEYKERSRKFGSDNYIPHLRGLITILRKTIPSMDEDEMLALKTDTAGLVALLEEL